MTPEQIYKALNSQRFADFYSDNGEFGRHIMDDEGCKNKEEILKQISVLFCLPEPTPIPLACKTFVHEPIIYGGNQTRCMNCGAERKYHN